MRHKVSELEGALLDAAVALASGMNRHRLALPAGLPQGERALLQWLPDPAGDYWRVASDDAAPSFEVTHFNPSTDWCCGGPIIERERIELNVTGGGDLTWCAGYDYNPEERRYGGAWQWGSTPLVAAMRAYVASKVGDEIDLA